MRTTAREETDMVLLTRDAVHFGGMNLLYQLFLCEGGGKRSFLIRVCRDQERCDGALGSDISRALTDYHSIVRGTVTPSSLDDVLHELQYA